MKKRAVSYRDAGVDIDEADRAVHDIKKLARATFTPGVLTEIGSFGACFELPKKLDKPVLISSVDGVGTKLKIAFITGRHDTIGEDLVNHCVNDIAVQGADPMFFLDYFAVGKLNALVARDVVAGISRGCKANGCALIGGETAEMPGMYADGEYDLAGMIVGVAEKKRLITGARIGVGDVLIGLPSTGLHTNGYSLARKVLFEIGKLKPHSVVPELASTLAEELLKVHKSYLRSLQALRAAGILRGAAHITGGGITDNLPRILPPGAGAVIETRSWTTPPIFDLLRRLGNIPEVDFRRTFNLGIGMIVAVPAASEAKARKLLTKSGEEPIVLGAVIQQKPRRPRVQYA